MQKNNREPDPSPPAFGILSVLLALSLFFTVLSFGLWDGEGGAGELSAAVSTLEGFIESHPAIAVFLGWEEGFPS